VEIMRVRSTFLRPVGPETLPTATPWAFQSKSHDAAANHLNSSGVIAFGMLHADYRVKNCFIRLSIYRVKTASVGES
jgi:hypothetical protein